MKIPGELSPQELNHPCPPDLFDFQSTEELPPLGEIIGQDRATHAIEFGIEIPSEGYNVFALGPAGAGKTTVVHQFLERTASIQPIPNDWCYVNSFDSPDRPHALPLPAGRGCLFRDDMRDLIDELSTDMIRAFESDHHEQRKKDILRKMQEQQAAAFSQLERYLNERSFALMRTPAGLAIAPMMDGTPLSAEEYGTLDPKTKEQFEAHRGNLDEQMEQTMRQVREFDKETRAAVDQLDHELAEFVIGGHLQELRDKYGDCESVLRHLEEVERDIVQNASYFLAPAEQPQPTPQPAVMSLPGGRTPLARYEVNLLVNHCRSKGAPVVVETNPTYHNLMGRIEHRAEFGALVTHFAMIKAGALHRANGGYLVVEAKRLVSNPLAWDALKRALSNKQLRIEEMGEAYRVIASATLEPEPIPLDVKVILIGDPGLYYLLYDLDEDFRELFKVKADFETRMGRDGKSVHRYALFIAERCRQENLRHFDPTGVARVVEYGSELAEDQDKLSTRFADIADIVRESALWATRNDHNLVTGNDVQHALDERTYRSNRVEEHILEATQRGFLFVDTTGEVVGQVNGLSILSVGGYEFGKPSRITARTYVGKAGLVSIDREVKMTGPIHDKGALILTGYLGGRYAQKKPLSLSASIVFEQAYEGVEGDSASSTELYALLSSLSDIPIRQGIAVTGSVNQHGEIQPVGGITRKIEGFFDVCKRVGLTGEQGVVIPAPNARNLTLRDDVVTAVASAQFHIYPVRTVDEGISILTAHEAGSLQEDGTYPEGTINALVTEKLLLLAKESKKSREEEADEHCSPSSEEKTGDPEA